MGEWLMPWLEGQVHALNYAVTWLAAQVSWIVTVMFDAVNRLGSALQALGAWIVAGARLIKNALAGFFRALAHLNFRAIWNALKRAYKRLKDARAWWRDHVQAPLDRIRAQIHQLYRTFFRPIINIIESMRGAVRILSIFNRRLAARLDQRLAWLESKVMWPITTMLHRLNAISSYVRALFTASGLLDRIVVIESIRRDALLVWEVLTNPRAVIYAPEKPGPPRSTRPVLREHIDDAHVYLSTGGGPLAPDIDAVLAEAREILLEVS
jgi:hypothetical protein